MGVYEVVGVSSMSRLIRRTVSMVRNTLIRRNVSMFLTNTLIRRTVSMVSNVTLLIRAKGPRFTIPH